MSFGIPVRNGLAVGLLASTYLSSRRAAYPAMSLNFLQPFLDSRITFSRGSNATLVDATGKIVYAPNNQLTYSQDFTNAAWVSSNTPIRTPGQVDPDGGTTATKLELDVNDGIYQFVGSRTGSYVFSIWVRGDVAGTIRLSDASSGAFNINVPVTTAWTRVDTGSRAVSGFFSPYIYRDTGNLATVYVAFAQLEQVTYQTTPSTYVATTASAYYGPRFDYDPVTLAPKGLLIEEARTNLLTYSDQFDNAAWIKLNATVTANGTASPDGTTNADKLVEDATNSVHIVYQGPAFAGSTTYTVSLFAKAAERSKLDVFCNGISATATNLFEVTFDLSNGTFLATQGTATITPFGNGWYRCTVTNTYAVIGTSANIQLRLNNGTTTSYAGTPGFGMFLWGAGLEAGSFATSYIPTVASTVTRSADVATMTGTNFSSWYNQSEGSFVVSYSRIQTVDTSAMVLEVKPTSISTTDRINISNSNLTDPRFQVFVGGVSQLDTTTTFGTLPVGTGVNAALAYKSGDNAAVRNGSAPVTSASTFTAPSYTNMQIGGTDNSIFGAAATTLLNGHIRQIAYYNTRLPNAQLQTLTAPSLATTLSLSFTNQAYTVGV